MIAAHCNNYSVDRRSYVVLTSIPLFHTHPPFQFGDFCEDPEKIGLEVACWLRDPQLLDVMSRKAMKVGHPHAAEEIAMDIGETTHRWMERNESKQNNGASIGHD